VTAEGRVQFIRPTTLEEFDNQPENWPYRVSQYGGETRSVEVEYKGNRLVMPYITPREAVQTFENGVRAFADIAATVEQA